MKCKHCGKEMVPIDVVESPIYSEHVATEYECPNTCEFLRWID